AAEHLAVLKRRLTAHCIRRIVVIVIVAGHEFASASFAVAASAERRCSFDLGGEIASHAGTTSASRCHARYSATIQAHFVLPGLMSARELTAQSSRTTAAAASRP